MPSQPELAALLLLAAAVVVAPGPPGRRLTGAGPCRRPRWVTGAVTAVFGCGVAVLVPPAVAVAAGVAGAVLTARRRRRLRDLRRRRDGEVMAAALEILVGELRVGAHPVTALGVAAEDCDGPVGGALRTVAGRARLGADVAAGLSAMAEGSSIPVYWERMAVCWRLAAEHGLPVSTLMRTAHRDIVDRQRFADRVAAGSAGARATAAILAGLPVLGVLIGQLVGAHPLRFLVGGGAGGWLLSTGLGLIGLGLMWADRIIDRAAR